MNCQCGKEITTKAITGDLCTSCYFKSKASKTDIVVAVADRAIGEFKAGEFDYSKPSEIVVSETSPISNLIAPEKPVEPLPVKLGHAKDNPEDPSHKPSKDLEVPVDGKKYCQSCIERYGKLVLATREWTVDYFICDDCFTPLIENITNIPLNAAKKVSSKLTSNSPQLEQIYELLGIPKELRFNSSDAVLRARNDIFNYHAPSIVNMTLEAAQERIELYTVLLFQVKIAAEPIQDYINKIKHEERVKAELSGLSKSEKEYTKGPSKIKMSKDEKMAKSLGMTTERYLEMVKSAKTQEFKKLTS